MQSSDADQAVVLQMGLAQDALRTVQESPDHVPSWWRLVDRARLLPPDLQAALIAQLRGVATDSPQAVWLLHSALWCLTGDAGHLLFMVEPALRLGGADRRMALASLVWHTALTGANDRAAFRQFFIATRQTQLMQAMAQDLPRAVPARERSGSIQRVAVVASHLSAAGHAGTHLVFDLHALLESAGIATHVFSAQELTLPTMGSYLAGANQLRVAPADPTGWRIHNGLSAQVGLANTEFSIGARWAQLAASVAGYAPDVVLFVGFASPLVWALRRDYPVLGMSVHTLPPLAPVDVWLAADPHAGADAFWPDLPPPQAVHYPHRFWPAGPAAGDRTAARAAIDVPTDAVLLVSSGHRLQVEATPEWTQSMVAFLDAHPGAHWLLVGVHESHRAAFAALHARVRVLPHQDYLAHWLRAADIYVNPPRMGGGASVALAMDLGLAVVSLSGSDGGDKVGDLAAPHTKVYFERLAQWTNEPGLRREAAATLERRFRQELDISRPDACTRLIRACQEAQACFERRRGEPDT